MESLARFKVSIGVLLALLLGGCEHSNNVPGESSEAPPPISSKPTSRLAPTERPRPSAGLPKFSVLKENTSLGVAFVVPVDTTDEQLERLLWLFRDRVRARQFAELGLRSPEWSESSNGGLFQVYRGQKCAMEMYVLNSPCGNTPHAAAYFQWGLRQDLSRDAGYIQKDDGTEDLIFGYND